MRDGRGGVLLCGDYGHHEFRGAVDWLAAHTQHVCAAGLDLAPDWLARLAPQTILVAQSRPGQYAACDIERLHAAAPLARLVALLGSWCEGEIRSGWPWPGVVRVYWHQWLARADELLSANHSCWHLPRTASDVDVLLERPAARPARQRGLVAVAAPTQTAFEILADVCQMGGYSAVWLVPGQGVFVRAAAAAIWDGGGWDSLAADQMARLARSLAPAPVIALIGFPRHEDWRGALEAGATAVVSKPFLVQDLLGELARAPRRLEACCL